MRVTTPSPVHRPRLLGDPTLVWRGPEALQIGLDSDAIVLDSVPRGVEAVVRRLDGTRTKRQLAPWMTEPWLTWLLDALAEHGRLTDGPGRREPVTVRLIGGGALAAAVGDALLAAGMRLRLTDPPHGPVGRARQLAGLLCRGRSPAISPQVEPELDLRARVTATLVATDTVEPDRALTQLLVRARLPHLVVRAHTARAVVGPFVLPGSTACLCCADLARTTADPDWPVVACELSRVSEQPGSTLTAWAAALAVAHVDALASGGRPESLLGTLELGRDGLTRFRRWARHPGCSCRASDLESAADTMVA